ncbi:MAG: helix-turn-helix domain-containing protein [Ktedonobacteraceae bacterium]|nr:helix-turn-helix domain-containing protein [Ktedonobacteraceae bacterium]
MSASSASVRNILTLLSSRDAQLVAGAAGLEHRVTWACHMRARLPAFDMVQGGELALLKLAQLRSLDETLPHLLKTLHKAGVAAVAVAAPSVAELGEETLALADQLHIPLILLPPTTIIEEIEREIIAFVVNFRGEIERKATEIAQQLMELSAQGVGIQGVCERLATSRGRWVIVQDAEHRIRYQAAPAGADVLLLPFPLTDEWLRMQSLTRVMEPILIRHEIVGYLSLIGYERDFDYQERIILGKVAAILKIEFARERERSEVESRYQVEAFTDILQGNYQQPEEMLARARLLGYDLTIPQVVVVCETSTDEHEIDYTGNGTSYTQWGRRVRDELLRAWPGCWVLGESRRVVALLPFAPHNDIASDEQEHENEIFTRLERIHTRLLSQKSPGRSTPLYSCGCGRLAHNLQSIPQSFREAQQALEIGRRLFGEGQLHSFARLGVYRLLFYLDGQSEINDFYRETLGPLLSSDTRNDNALLETLESYFRCNGNLSETARAMHLHRNSLLYRLERIEALLGRSLEDSEVRLNLQIALKIHHMRKR